MDTEKERQPNIVVVGGGGVGFYFTLAMLRAIDDPKRIQLFDHDDLRGGLGHARLPVASPETRKVDLLRGFARVAMGDVPPQTHDALFTGVECEAGDIVVDCSDMATKARAEVWKAARAKGARCIRVSYDGAQSTVVVAEGLPLETESATGQQGGGGYDAVPSLALSFMAGGLGAEAVRLLLANPACHIENQVSVAEWLVKAPATA